MVSCTTCRDKFCLHKRCARLSESEGSKSEAIATYTVKSYLNKQHKTMNVITGGGGSFNFRRRRQTDICMCSRIARAMYDPFWKQKNE